VDATPARLHRELAWEEAAERSLEVALEQLPILTRISAAKQFRDAAEGVTRALGLDCVTAAQVAVATRELSPSIEAPPESGENKRPGGNVGPPRSTQMGGT